MCLAVRAAGHPVGEALLLFGFVLQAAEEDLFAVVEK